MRKAGYETLDEWISDWVFEMLEMYVDGELG
jgi:hypothetical protein